MIRLYMDKKEIETINRRYKWIYMIIPIPMIAGIILVIYAYNVKDDHVDSFCAVATQSQAYAESPLREDNFKQFEEMKLPECLGLDEVVDNDDGRKGGKVRWFICTGMSCGPGWHTILAE